MDTLKELFKKYNKNEYLRHDNERRKGWIFCDILFLCVGNIYNYVFFNSVHFGHIVNTLITACICMLSMLEAIYGMHLHVVYVRIHGVYLHASYVRNYSQHALYVIYIRNYLWHAFAPHWKVFKHEKIVSFLLSHSLPWPMNPPSFSLSFLSPSLRPDFAPPIFLFSLVFWNQLVTQKTRPSCSTLLSSTWCKKNWVFMLEVLNSVVLFQSLECFDHSATIGFEFQQDLVGEI